MIEYHDPHAATSIKATPYALAIPTSTANALTIGLLANGFPDSENFLNHIAAVLQTHEPDISFEYYNKGNASIPASPEILASIKTQCQAVITAYGH
jgi:hypothetical protein